MKLPIWIVDNQTYVTVRSGFAIHEREYAYVGRTRCSIALHTWVRGLPVVKHPKSFLEPLAIDIGPPLSMPL